MRNGASPFFFACSLLVAGCVSVSPGQTARPLGTGNWELGADYSAQVTTAPLFRTNYGTNYGPGYWFHQLNVAGRYGLTPRWDVGVRVGTSMIEANAKFLLLEATPFRLAVLPTSGGYWITDGTRYGGFALATTSLLASLELWPRSEVVIAGRIGLHHGGFWSTVETDLDTALGAAASVGWSVPVAFGVAVMPELSFWHPLVLSGPVAASVTPTSAPLRQLTLSITWRPEPR